MTADPSTVRIRLGPVVLIWASGPGVRARRAISAAVCAAVTLAAAYQLRVPASAPGPTAEQRRVLVAADRAADPGLAGLTDRQLDQLARMLCAALDRGADPAHPALNSDEAGATGIFALTASSYDTATALAAAAYCPAHSAAVREANPQ